MSRVPVSDPLLGFVLDFCNTYDLLEDPPDRLTIPLANRIATRHDLPAFALTPADLEPLRTVRNQLYGVFAADAPADQAEILNTLFATHGAIPRLLLTPAPPPSTTPAAAPPSATATPPGVASTADPSGGASPTAPPVATPGAAPLSLSSCSADSGVRLAATGGAGPVGRLAVLAADALARAMTAGSGDRLRTCVGDPCRCVYVDRTKANRQRYCCELCNDRMASAAYRRRNR
jgi:hypothetical protein